MKSFLKNRRLIKNIRNFFRTRKIMSESEGQIKLESPPGKLIYDFINNENIKNVLEIGTWNGLGSTIVIYESLEKNNEPYTFTSIETDKIAYQHALKNLKDKKGIKLVLGRIIDIEDLPNPDLIDFKKHNLNPENIEWFYQDLRRYKKTKNIFNELNEFYDFILFDGGEFSTFIEFKKLYKRTKFFALDDIDTYKQYEVLNYIKNDPDKFELINTVEDLSIYKVNT